MPKTKRSHSATLTRTLAKEIFLALGTELSQSLACHLERGDKDGDVRLLEVELPDPNGYDDWRAFFRDYAAVSLLSKSEDLFTGIDLKQVAIDKFLLCEETCHDMNIKFSHPDSDPFLDSDVSQVFHLARRKIRRVLGDFSWDEVGKLAAFGPGAAVGVPRRFSHVVHKFGYLKPTVTGECATLAAAFIKASPQWSSTVPVLSGRTEDCFEIVQGSRITTVAKSAKTDRVIAIEPLMNMFFQKGIGKAIRRRLKTVKVNLDDQTRNQQLAYRGSVDDSLATIDLASASDTVSRGVVEWLVPETWVEAMKIVRSKSCTLPSGETHFLQKFSSMGNGYTFELESLIFWALASSCCATVGVSSHDLGVYGDDIIVPSRAADLTVKVLLAAGFKTNRDKTFLAGPFRESCGKHYFQGHDVTPLYIRKGVSEPERKLWLANGIRRLAHRLVGYDYGCDASLRGVYSTVVSSLPPYLKRLSIPEGFGDGGVVRDFDEARPKRHRSFDAFVTKHAMRVYSSRVACNQPAITTALFFLDRRDSDAIVFQRTPNGITISIRGEVPLEIPTSRYSLRVVKLVTDRWCGLGPWVDGF